jgi:hypothetical protein
MAAAFIALLTVAALRCAPAAAELERVEHPAKNDGSLSLLVIGDWGRKGTYNQSRVAEQVHLLRLISSWLVGRIVIWPRNSAWDFDWTGEEKNETAWRLARVATWHSPLYSLLLRLLLGKDRPCSCPILIFCPLFRALHMDHKSRTTTSIEKHALNHGGFLLLFLV